MKTRYARKLDKNSCAIYDENMQHLCTFHKYYCSKIPDKRYKYITLNCFVYRLQWLEG